MSNAFRDNLRKVASSARSLATRFGVRPYAVKVRVRTWSGGERGEGTPQDTEVAMVERRGGRPKVRFLSEEERAIGGYESATVEVGPMTPNNLVPRSALEPATDGNDVVSWILTGPSYPDGGAFRLVKVTDDRGYQFTVTLQRVPGA